MVPTRSLRLTFLLWPVIATGITAGPVGAQSPGPPGLTVDAALAAYEGACRAIEWYDLTITTSSAILLTKRGDHDRSRDRPDKSTTPPTDEWAPADPGNTQPNNVRISRQYYGRAIRSFNKRSEDQL